ncbi:tetratricopeptide repeat protein [Streptomyces sp. NPDC048825]|uniref:tetratricopeptide repeat protein n=1 Tax=Streptomyces sp. NPDC048825 TaxID=3365592 RepID=UPI0037172597
MALAAFLDPAGHPDALWATAAVTDYLTTNRSHQRPEVVTTHQADKAVRLLHRYGLLTHTRQDGARALRTQALTARAAREARQTTLDPAAVARTAADALLEIWPDVAHAASSLTEALRSNTAVLTTHAGDTLWQPHLHHVLWKAGRSLYDAGLHNAGIAYWQHTADKAERILGPHHPDTITARANLARTYRQAGRANDALNIDEQVLADRERVLGPDHPDTLWSHRHLAGDYRGLGRYQQALALDQQVLADRERVLRADHLDTLWSRAAIAEDYRGLGRYEEALALEQQVLADRERILGHRPTQHDQRYRFIAAVDE